MYRLCTNFIKNSNSCTIYKSNVSIPRVCGIFNGYKSRKHFRNIRNLSSGINEDKNHESDYKKDSLVDLLIELNYKENNRYSPSSKLRLLYNILNNDKNYEITYSSHIASILLDLWKSRGFLNTSELSLFDKICHDLSEKVWEILPFRKNELSDSVYYRQLKHDLRVLNEQVLSPTPEQHQKKEKLISYLKPLFESTINGTLHTFGSCDNGLWSRGSDIDLCLLIPNCDSKRYMLSKLSLIKSCLSNSDIISKISIISARVPIVKLYYVDNNNLCDISINNSIALHNSEYVKTMCKLDERVVIMGRFIKYWATCRKINNRAEGTMSSYTLILQLFYYLQNRNPPIIPTLREIEINPTSSDESEQSLRADDCETRQQVDNVHEDEEESDFISREYNYLTNPMDILSRCEYLNNNNEDVIDLLLGFFEFYSHSRFSGGMSCSTIDMYANEITENNNGYLIVKCPLSRKNVNPFTIRMWQSIYGEFKRAHNLILLKQPISTLCQEVHLSPLEEQIQQRQINQEKLIQLFK